MRRQIAILLALVAVSNPYAVSAKPMTCGELKDRFEGRIPGPLTLGGSAIDPGAELLGVVATHAELCLPQGIVLGTLRAVFVHWADGNPKLMKMPSWDCVARAFAESFPCRQGPAN